MLQSALFRRHVVPSVFTLLLFLLLAGNPLSLSAQNCCNNGLTRVYTAPLPDNGELCCFRVYGTAWCTSANIATVDIHESYFGSWISAAPPASITGVYNFSFDLCKPKGHHVFRLTFKDYDGQPLCTKDITYDCGKVDCCENVSVSPVGDRNDPDNCCYVVAGNTAQCPSVAHYIAEKWENGQWQAFGAGDITDRFNPWFRSEVTCLPRVNSPYKFRVTLVDALGKNVCTKELGASCNYAPCCDIFQFEVEPGTSSDPKQCCFTIRGTESDLCGITTDYTIEEQINGQWQNLMGGAYARLEDKKFEMSLCRTKGSYHFRVILRSGGDIYCVKEVEYSCEDECCQYIQVLPGEIIHQETCCRVTFAIVPDKCSGKVTTFQVEKYTFGQWKNDQQVYLIDPGALSTSYSSCVPFGTTKIRFIFYGSNETIECIRDVDFDCNLECCDLLSVEVSSQADVKGKCCFDFTIKIPECLKVSKLLISEMNRSGRWIVKQTSPLSGGTMSLRYCISATALPPARVRFAFCDDAGNVICVRDFVLDCWYTNDPDGDGGMEGPGKKGDNNSGNLLPDTSVPGIVFGLNGVPNPAIDETLLSYTLAQDAAVSIELVDALGQRTPVQSLPAQAKGPHSLSLSTHNLAAGMYTVVVKANGTVATLQLVIVR